MEDCKKTFNGTNIQIQELGKNKDEVKTVEESTKKTKPSGRKKKLFCKFGFYITILLIIINGTGSMIMWFTSFYDNAIVQYLTIKENSSFYYLWRHPKSDLIIKVYPFNYTNMNDVMTGKEKLKVKEIGPYVFRENSRKDDVKFNGIESVTYSYNRTITFLREYTRGTLNDTIITPNVVYISATDKVSKDPFQQTVLNMALAGFKSKPFIKISSYEFIMGYDDNFSYMLRRINTLLRKEVHTPFGILGKRVGFNTDRITIGTGVPDLDSFGIIKKYNENEQLDVWNDSSCNSIRASDGFLFPRSTASNSDVIYIYAKDLCRRIPLKFEKEFTTEEGFPVRRFIVPRDVYSTPDINPENSCFCTASCPLSGIQDVSPCFYDAPFVISQPHFMYADNQIFEKIDGLHPCPEKHTYFTDLHKVCEKKKKWFILIEREDLGFPLKSISRVQLGIIVNKGTTLSRRYKSLRNGIVLPIAWMEFELASLPENINQLLYHVTFTAPMLKIIMRWSFLIFFFISFIRLVFYLYPFFHK